MQLLTGYFRILSGVMYQLVHVIKTSSQLIRIWDPCYNNPYRLASHLNYPVIPQRKATKGIAKPTLISRWQASGGHQKVGLFWNRTNFQLFALLKIKVIQLSRKRIGSESVNSWLHYVGLLWCYALSWLLKKVIFFSVIFRGLFVPLLINGAKPHASGIPHDHYD